VRKHQGGLQEPHPAAEGKHQAPQTHPHAKTRVPQKVLQPAQHLRQEPSVADTRKVVLFRQKSRPASKTLVQNAALEKPHALEKRSNYQKSAPNRKQQDFENLPCPISYFKFKSSFIPYFKLNSTSNPLKKNTKHIEAVKKASIRGKLTKKPIF